MTQDDNVYDFAAKTPQSFGDHAEPVTEQLCCDECQKRIGVATSHFRVEFLSPVLVNGAIRGATIRMVCIACENAGVQTYFHTHWGTGPFQAP